MKAESGASLDHDSSDDDDEEDEEAMADDGMDETESDPGMSPPLGTRSGKGTGSIAGLSGSVGALEKVEGGGRIGGGSIVPGSGAEKIFGNGFDGIDTLSNAGLGLRPGTAAGRGATRSGRPATADGEGRRMAIQKNFMIRIFRLDGTFSTLPVTLSATAQDLTTILARKFQVNSSTAYALFLREKGLGTYTLSLQHFVIERQAECTSLARRTQGRTERKTGTAAEAEI